MRFATTFHKTLVRTWLPPLCLSVLFYFQISGGIPVWAQEGTPNANQPRLSEIRGIVQIRGCAPKASQIELRAVPLHVDAPTLRDTAATTDPRPILVPARVMPTGDPHVFSFLIGGLQPVTLYGLSIFLSQDLCGKVFWRSDSQGLAVTGGDPVLIEGVAATTSLEVQEQGTGEWVSADALDFTDPAAARRRLRWRSNLPGVVRGELQISTVVFPNRGTFGACDEPEGGIVYRQTVPAVLGEWKEIDAVDFNRILLSRDNRDDSVATGDGAKSSTLRLLLLGAPVYARIVPITLSGPACDTVEQGVPGWVVLAKLLGTIEPPKPEPATPVLEPNGPHKYFGPFLYRPSAVQPEAIKPSYGDTGYRVVKPHPLPSYGDCDLATASKLHQSGIPSSQIPAYSDPLGCKLVRTYPQYSSVTVGVGFRFYFQMTWSTGGGGSIIDQVFKPFFTGLVKAVGLAVTTAAEVYNSAVNAVKGLAYKFLLAVPGVGAICDSNPELCKKAIAAGMTYGMTAMGLPPSLPNWDQLKQDGLEYLASQVGEEIDDSFGVPSALTQEALISLTQTAIDQMTANRGGIDPSLNWLVPDSGFEPASWTVTVWKHGLDPLPVDVVLVAFKTNLYEGAAVPLPRKFPPPKFPLLFSRALRIPMVLRPNLSGIPAPYCTSSWYTNPHQKCEAQTIFAKPYPICVYQSNTGPKSPYQDDKDCWLFSDLVATYYRDAWVSQKLAPSSCAPISAMTFGQILLVRFIEPGLTFYIGADVRPSHAATWTGPAANFCLGK